MKERRASESESGVMPPAFNTFAQSLFGQTKGKHRAMQVLRKLFFQIAKNDFQAYSVKGMLQRDKCDKIHTPVQMAMSHI